MSHPVGKLTGVKALDDAIARLAQGQHEVFTRRQAHHLGLTHDAVLHAIRTGLVEVVAGDVLRFSSSPRTWRQELMVAVLAGGPDAAVAQLSAAALLRCPGFNEGPVESVRLRGSDHDAVYGRLHETRVLPAHHLTVIDGITTTNIARTVFDLAGRIHPERLRRLLDFADLRYRAVPQMRAMLPELAVRGRRGIRAMRVFLDSRDDGLDATESQAEALALRVLRKYGVPVGVAQVALGDDADRIGRVDRYYREERLIVEIDSRRYHGGEVAQLEDARRRAQYAAIGLRVLPAYYKQIKADPAWFANLVRRALASTAKAG